MIDSKIMINWNAQRINGVWIIWITDITPQSFFLSIILQNFPKSIFHFPVM